jgi:hypothetical protein
MVTNGLLHNELNINFQERPDVHLHTTIILLRSVLAALIKVFIVHTAINTAKWALHYYLGAPCCGLPTNQPLPDEESLGYIDKVCILHTAMNSA